MSKYAEGTTVQHSVAEAVKYRLNSRTEGDETPWVAIDVPPLLTTLMGDANNEVRFTDDDISGGIERGGLVVIYAP